MLGIGGRFCLFFLFPGLFSGSRRGYLFRLSGLSPASLFIPAGNLAIRGKRNLPSGGKHHRPFLEIQYQIGIYAGYIHELQRPGNQIGDSGDLDLLEELSVLHQAVFKGINSSAFHLGIDLGEAGKAVFLRSQLFGGRNIGLKEHPAHPVEPIGVAPIEEKGEAISLEL